MKEVITITNDKTVICRACETNINLQPLYDGLSNTLAMKLMSCVNIQVNEDDGLPQTICENCINLLNMFYAFKLQCKKIDTKLREIALTINYSVTEMQHIKTDRCSPKVDETALNHNKYEDYSLEDFVNSIDSPEYAEIKKNSLSDKISSNVDQEISVTFDENPNDVTNFSIIEPNLVDVSNSDQTENSLEKPLLQRRKCYPCTACNKQFDSYNKWIEHRKTHGSKKYLCLICKKLFAKKAYLDKHQKTHKDINEIKKFECNLCFKTYTSKGNLQRHMRLHTGDKRHICDICGKRFIQSTTLRSHQLTHQDIKSYSCKECDKSFKSKQYLIYHREKLHNKFYRKKPFCCEICGSKFINERNLKWHIRNHIRSDSNTPNKIVKKPKPRQVCCICTYCGKTFKQRAQLHIHQRVHTGEKPYECEKCHKRFRFQTSFKFHQNSHTGERPFVCTLCNKSFKQPTHLRNHLKVHTGVKPYKCTYCAKSFASKSNLKVHTRIHTGERPYVCNDCGRSFLDSNGLKKHYKRHLV